MQVPVPGDEDSPSSLGPSERVQGLHPT
jgi:hypothetical protein